MRSFTDNKDYWLQRKRPVGTMSEIQYREQIEKTFLSHLSDIRAKQTWKTHFDIEFSWDRMMHLLDTHPTKHLKWKEDKQKVEI